MAKELIALDHTEIKNRKVLHHKNLINKILISNMVSYD